MMPSNVCPPSRMSWADCASSGVRDCSIKVAANWVVSGAARWDLEANKLNQYIVGAGYVDDCFVLAANYVTSYQYSAGVAPPVLSHAFMLQIGLRTLATTSSSASPTSGGLQ